jgi:hypothetical protein
MNFSMRVVSFFMALQFALVHVVPAYAINVQSELTRFVTVHNGAKKEYKKDVGLYLKAVLPTLSKEDREFFIGMHQKYYAEKGVAPEFVPAKIKDKNTVIIGKNGEAVFEVVNFEKREMKLNGIPFTVKAGMPAKYHHAVIMEILQNSKSASTWSLVPQAHAWDWLSFFVGAGGVGLLWWLFGTKSGEKTVDKVQDFHHDLHYGKDKEHKKRHNGDKD